MSSSSSNLAESHQNESSSSSSSQPLIPESKKCAFCNTTPANPSSELEPESVLKPCPKCHTTLYCGRQCMKNDFKSHKKVCAKLAQEYSKTADLKMESSGARAVKESHRGGLQKWQFDT